MAINYLSSFNSGELSEKMNGRTGLEIYRNGCRLLENFYALPQGGVERRTGTKYIAQTKNDTAVRLVPFMFSADQSYALEFGAGYCRAYDALGVTTEVTGTIPYTVDEVRQLQYAQRYDLMFFVNGVSAVQKLSRTSLAPAFEMEELEFTYPPLLEENDTDTTITPSAVDVASNPITLTASSDLFDAGHEGSYWRIRHERTAAQQSISGSLSGTSHSAGLDLSFSDWKITTGGTWTGLVELQQSIDGGVTWEKLAVLGDTTGAHDKNFSLDSETPAGQNTQIRVSVTGMSSGFGYNLYAENTYIEGLVKIVTYTSATSVTANVINELGSTSATKKWTEGAFSDYRGHPRTVTFHEDRLWFCGTDYEPATIFASVSGDYFNFLQGTQVDSSIRRTPESPEPAEWMASKKVIRLGTSGGAMTVQSVDDRENINVDTISTPSQSEYGSEYIQAILTNDVVVYVQKSGRKVREMIYNWEEENYRSNDITILSEQITDSGVVEGFLQKQPDQLLHFIKENGDIAALTYERPQEVVGWARFTTNGSFVSGCALPSPTGQDSVFVCVERNGQYNIELFQQREDLDWYVDSGVKVELIGTQDVSNLSTTSTPQRITITAPSHGYSGGENIRFLNVGGMDELNEQIYTVEYIDGDDFMLLDETGLIDVDGDVYTPWTSGGDFIQVTNTIDGLDHLEGQTVQVVGDGSYVSDETVTSGAITFDSWSNVILAGEQYISYMQPMFQEPALGDRLSSSRKKAVSKCSFKVYNTIGALIGKPDGRKAPLIQRNTFDVVDQPVAVETGEHRIFIANDWKREKDIEIEQNLPYPLTVLSMAVWTRTEGG